MRSAQFSRLAVPFGLAIIAGVALAVPALAGQGRHPNQAPAAPAVIKNMPRPNIPQLDDQERNRALSIATSDPVVAGLLAGRQHAVKSIGVWHTKDLRKLGAGIVFTLERPASFELDWPYAQFDGGAVGGLKPYQQLRHHFTVDDVTRLAVLVDLNTSGVAQITPGPGATLRSLAPGVPVQTRPTGD
jgi:hypothetical protein